MLKLSAKAAVSMNADGVLQFNADAMRAFRGQPIEFVAVCDERSGRTAMRPLVAVERKALSVKGPVPFPQIARDEESPRDYLRFVGIKIRARKNYEAYLIGGSKGILVRVL